MTIYIRLALSSDEDFCLKSFCPLDNTLFGMQNGDGYDYYTYRAFRAEETEARKLAKDFLADTLCEIHVSSLKYYLIKRLYELFNSAIISISKNKDYFGELKGNYEGTYIRVEFVPDKAQETFEETVS